MKPVLPVIFPMRINLDVIEEESSGKIGILEDPDYYQLILMTTGRKLQQNVLSSLGRRLIKVRLWEVGLLVLCTILGTAMI